MAQGVHYYGDSRRFAEVIDAPAACQLWTGCGLNCDNAHALAVYFVIKEGETKPGEVGSATATGDAYHRGKSRKSTK